MDRWFEEKEKKMEGRFDEMSDRFDKMEKMMDRRFDETEEKMDKRFKYLNRCFDEQECSFRDLQVQLENAAAITMIGRLHRMHQPINFIKVKILKDAGYPKIFEWAPHPQAPKNMKSTYILGQTAKGVFEPGWEEKSDLQSMYSTADSII